MTSPSRRATLTPVWWVVVAWLAMFVAHTWAAHHGRFGLDLVATRALAGFLFAAAGAALLAARDSSPARARAIGVVVAILIGLTAVALSPAGLGEVPVFLAAARIPAAFSGRTATWVAVAATILTGATIGLISHSVAGILAGAGVPLLAQRALDRRILVEERDRAQALLVEVEAARDTESQAAALRERGRIAREMHDVLAHSLAGLSLQLQAVRAIAQKEGASPSILEPLDRAAALARDGLVEAKSAVGALADTSLRGAAEIADLVTNHPGEVWLTVSGEPVALSADAGHAAYRAVQESLTNAARYAPGSPVEVALVWSPDTLRVQIDDHGAAPGHTPVSGQGTGLGLGGMRERLAAVGGRVHAGPAGTGWRVAVEVPARSLVGGTP